MQEQLIIDPEILGIIVNSILAVIATLVAVMSFNTSNRVSKIESRIKETEFTWKTRERIRRELVAKLRISHILQLWVKSFEIIGDIPSHENLDSLRKELKPLVDEYCEVVPEALALHNEIDLGLSAGNYTAQDDILALANSVTEVIEKFQEDNAGLT